MNNGRHGVRQKRSTNGTARESARVKDRALISTSPGTHGAGTRAGAGGESGLPQPSTIEYMIRVSVPITDVWLSSMLGLDQYFQVRFKKQPTQQDIDKVIALLKLVQDGFKDAAPQPSTATRNAEPSQEGPGQGDAAAAASTAAWEQPKEKP